MRKETFSFLCYVSEESGRIGRRLIYKILKALTVLYCSRLYVSGKNATSFAEDKIRYAFIQYSPQQ